MLIENQIEKLDPAIWIPQSLQAIEKAEGVEILMAIESGSRAWGFASPDSDYDVRFLYRKPATSYFGVDAKTPDTIDSNNGFLKFEFPYDFAGWDITKALGLLRKGNATLSEWIDSPIQYKSHVNPVFMRFLKEQASNNFNPLATFFHYKNLAKTDFKASDFTLKRLLYTFRATLAAHFVDLWGTMPPVRMIDLAHSMVDTPGFETCVVTFKRMQNMKRNAHEKVSVDVNSFPDVKLWYDMLNDVNVQTINTHPDESVEDCMSLDQFLKFSIFAV